MIFFRINFHYKCARFNFALPSNHLCKTHQIQQIKCFLARFLFRQEWRCSWSSADRRCSNYIWVVSKFIAYEAATYSRDWTVLHFWWYHNVKIQIRAVLFDNKPQIPRYIKIKHINFPTTPLWPGDAIWQHRSGSTLIQVMAPSHYMNKLSITEVQWQTSENNFTRDTSAIDHKNSNLLIRKLF